MRSPHETKSTVTAGSGTFALWRCPDGHAWTARCSDRRIYGCPECAAWKKRGEKPQQFLGPQLQKECLEVLKGNPSLPAGDSVTDAWRAKHRHTDYSKETVPAGSKCNALWQCTTGRQGKGGCQHLWIATIQNRAGGSGCPNCANTNRFGRSRNPYNSSRLSDALQQELIVVLSKDWKPKTSPQYNPRWKYGGQEHNDWVKRHRHQTTYQRPGKKRRTVPEKSVLTVCATAREQALWKCTDCQHRWTQTVASRVKSKSCPKCRELARAGPITHLSADLQKECQYILSKTAKKDMSIPEDADEAWRKMIW